MVSHLSYPHFVGGVEKYVFYVSKELVRLGIDVEIYTTDPTGKNCGKAEIEGIIFHQFKSIAPNGIYYFSRKLLNELTKLRDIDIVHSNAYGTYAVLASVLAKKVNKTPTIVQPHLSASKTSRIFHQLYNPIFGNYIFSRCDRVIVVSPAEFEALPLLRNYFRKAMLISNGVDFSEVNHFYRLRNRSHFGNGTLRLLCVSRLERMKGLKEVLYVIEKIKMLPISLAIVGDGPERPHLQRLSRELGLEKQIKFYGRVSDEDLYQIYSEADIFLSLSKYESNSMSLIEAMAFGVVPIVTAVGGNQYIIKHGENGILVPYPVDISSIKMKLEELIKNEDRLVKLGGNARKKAMQEFDIKRNATKLVKMYQNTLAQTK
jgi:glycosyltransferase involved in cell wall biosynthesis